METSKWVVGSLVFCRQSKGGRRKEQKPRPNGPRFPRIRQGEQVLADWRRHSRRSLAQKKRINGRVVYQITRFGTWQSADNFGDGLRSSLTTLFQGNVPFSRRRRANGAWWGGLTWRKTRETPNVARSQGNAFWPLHTSPIFSPSSVSHTSFTGVPHSESVPTGNLVPLQPGNALFRLSQTQTLESLFLPLLPRRRRTLTRGFVSQTFSSNLKRTCLFWVENGCAKKNYHPSVVGPESNRWKREGINLAWNVAEQVSNWECLHSNDS